MTRMIRGSVLLAACVGLWSCSSDPTSSEAGVPYKIVSLPTVIFVKQDSSELVAFQLVDALDGQIPTEWTVTANSPLFTVTFDSTFRPVYNPDGTLTLPGQQTEARATISGVALGIDTLTVTASGKTLDVIVNVVPGTLHATFSPANPAPGDTVTMTMPAELRLDPTSAVTFTGNLPPIIVSRAADSMSLRFISAPTTMTNATVTKVWNTQFPTLPATTYPTEDKVVGTLSGAFNGFLPATFSTLAPSGPPVIMTMNTSFGVMPSTAISFTGQTAPIINNANVTGDSTVVNFSVGPNVNQKVNVTKVYAKGAPQFLYTLESSGFMVSPVVLNFPATTVSNTPVFGDTVTITMGPGFKLSPTSALSWAAGPAFVVSRAADSSSIRVIPLPGSTGVPTATLVLGAAFPGFQVTLPGSATSAIATLTHSSTATIASAPLLAVPGFYYDAGSFGGPASSCVAGGGAGCQFYKITVPAAARTFTVRWSNTTDLGLYFLNAGGSDIGQYGCDAHGNGATAQPETCTFTPPAGTYYLELDNYGPFYAPVGPPPAWVSIQIQ